MADIGRPEITDEEKKSILQKLEPYLKSGLSVRKALLEAKIPNSTFYMLMDRDEEFLEQINLFKQFVSVMLNSSIVNQIHDIISRQSKGETLLREDVEFMKWFATNSNLTRDEYGERKEVGTYDPEAEIHRINKLIEENTTKITEHEPIK